MKNANYSPNIDWSHTPSRSLPAKIQRRLTQWRFAAPAVASDKSFNVSFTFDDFPMSAVNGADIVEAHGGRAGFYACTSMIDTIGPYGEMFNIETMLELDKRGHEIGAHTHSHIDCALADKAKVLADIAKNLEELKKAGLEQTPTSLAYPFGETLFDTKKQVVEQFNLCRGILPGINVGKVDRAQLRCFELNGDPSTTLRAQEAIETAGKTGGWVIIFTHDVSPTPTDYGTTSATLEDLCKRSNDLGANLLPPTQAAKACGII
ncbi:polysaccharide deacetylase family protein [Hirschia litorea]|uniref:Chitooligosaccharide deacetylase n=1 Tax=Hirschia litorea TaxID=1199156 RepID=A0ABW2IH12_9PROT